MNAPGVAATVLVLLTGTCGAVAQGFECAPLVPSSARSPVYRMVAGQSRCEGFFDKTVSQPFLELVSLTRGLPPTPPAVGASSVAGVLEIHANAKGPLRLVVQPQRSNPFYRVDAALQGGQALSWDAAPMLKATGLPLSDLGFIALAGASLAAPGSVAAVAPVAFSTQALADKRVYAVVRVSVDVSQVAWRAYSKGAAATTASAWVDVPGASLFAWQRITLPIELPVDGKEWSVDVQAVASNNSQALPLLRFTIVGAGDGKP
jgi:hypothetical protein